MTESTKPKSATGFKETAFGILPRSEIGKLEVEGIKKAQQYIPFKDYNGRVARLLTNLLLLKLGFPILTIKAEVGKDRTKYVQAMQAADKHDPSKLESLLAKALEENLRKV